MAGEIALALVVFVILIGLFAIAYHIGIGPGR